MLKIKTDSRKVVPGDIFIALVGEQYDGHDFIDEAITNGAVKIISQQTIKKDIDIEIVTNTLQYLQTYLQKIYIEELQDLILIGITGTNGKTTTTNILYQLLNVLQLPTACIGTLGYITKQETVCLDTTTPDIVTLYNLLLRAKKEGIQAVVIEMSSHALRQQRVFGLVLDYGGFTNLTLDHLDYHHTMEEYLDAKKQILKLLKKSGKMIINVDDPYHIAFTKGNYISIGKQAKEYQIQKYHYQYPYSYLSFFKKRKYEVCLPYFGEFNMYNYLMAMAIVHDLGYPLEKIIEASSTLHSLEGRCQIFSLPVGHVIIDYAHTPDAILKILNETRKETSGRVITIIGCGGNRDQKKRPIIGEITTKYSDFVIFTNDNPRTEEPMKIINQMVAGVSHHNYIIIPDRKEAIAYSLGMLNTKDIVLLLGKGHETHQIIGNTKIEYSDRIEIQKYSVKKRK